MSKLGKSVLPSGHTKNDFKCFGPVAERDGEFSGTMLCDMGCFKQGEVDSNKYYHAAVVQSTINSKWYAYFEYGRTGQTTNPQFQMIEGTDKGGAQAEYEKQLHSKNDKRGMWVDKGVLGKVLQPKPNKDCYLVRPQSSRSVGLPDAKNITTQVTIATSTVGTSFDSESNKLIADLKVGSTDYARSSIVGESIPTKDAIDKCRVILDEATKINNKKIPVVADLLDLTGMAYSLIPKIKSRNVTQDDWILNPENIQKWRDDLDVYENVVSGQSVSTIATLPFDLKYISNKNEIYTFLSTFMTGATRNRHGNVGKLKINHIWETVRDDHYKGFREAQKKVIWDGKEKPLHQSYKTRPDIKDDEFEDFSRSGTWLLFHGTRSVNVGSILQTGLRLPKELSNVAINGALYGGGIYCADDWKKSAGYCSLNNSYWVKGGGGIQNRGAFMFICDMTLGNPYIVNGPRAFTEPPKGHHSIYAKGGGYVQNNEFIIFNKFQINLRYLVEFENV